MFKISLRNLTQDIYDQSLLVAIGKDIIKQILKFFHGHISREYVIIHF